MGRIVISGLLFSPWIYRSFKQINKTQLFWVVIVGLTGYLGAYLFMGLSQTHIDSSVAGILASLNPMFTFVLGLIFFKQAFRWKNLWGILLGMFGCVFLLFNGKSHQGWKIEHYTFFMMISVFISAITINIIHIHLKGLASITIAAASFGILMIPATLIFLFFTDVHATLVSPGLSHCALALLCLCMVSTVLGSLMYYHLIGKMGALYTSTVTYIIPLMAIVWGILDGETIGWNSIVGFIFILGGIKLIRA